MTPAPKQITRFVEEDGEAELVTFKQTRHRCPHCRRSFSNRPYAKRHLLEWCQKRMANHGCKTCALFHEGESPNALWNCPGCDRECGAGQDISAGLRVHCLHWGAIY